MATLVKKTVKASGGDYTYLAAAFNFFKNNYPNFVTSDIYAEIEISGSWSSADSHELEVVGITTDSTHYLHIYTVGDSRHDGKWKSTGYIYQNSFYITAVNYVIVDGLQILLPDYNGAAGFRTLDAFDSGGNSQIIIRNNLIRGVSGSYTGHRGMLLGYTTYPPKVYVYNNIIYNIPTNEDCRGIKTTADAYVYNCIVQGGESAIYREVGTLIVKNCYAATTGSGGCYKGTMTKTTCASSDTTGSTGLQNIAYSTDNFVNVTSGYEDLHLSGTGSALYHTGTDTSGDAAPMNFTTDIDGDNYYDTGGVRSIGADEIPAATVHEYTGALSLACTPAASYTIWHSAFLKWMDEGETILGDTYLKGGTPPTLYLGLYTNTSEPAEDDTLSDITEPSGANGYARIALGSSDWTEYPASGWFRNLQKTFSCSTASWGNVYGYFICTCASGTGGKLVTAEQFTDGPYYITVGDSVKVTVNLKFMNYEA
jgi:hypothetical protein